MRTSEITLGSRTAHYGNGLEEVAWFEDIWLKSATEETSVKALAARECAALKMRAAPEGFRAAKIGAPTESRTPLWWMRTTRPSR